MTQSSRRRFLKATVAVGAVAGLNVAVLAQDGDQKFVLLGARVEGWQPYRLPGDASAEEADPNPTLTLEAGTAYTLMWRNLDGVPHNFAILDSDGENLQVLQVLEVESDAFEAVNETPEDETIAPENVTVGNATAANVTTVPGDELVESTEQIGEEGAVQAVRFTATEEMAEYTCEVHPNTMAGDVEVTEAETGTETDTETTTTTETDGGDGGGY